MDALVREFRLEVVGPDGTVYQPQCWARQEPQGTWIGWLEFVPRRPGRAVRVTGQETSQPSLRTLEYWAGGLEAVYFEGAFERARGRRPSRRGREMPRAAHLPL